MSLEQPAPASTAAISSSSSSASHVIRAHARRCEPSSYVHVIYASRPTRGRRAVAESTPQKTISMEAPDWWLAGRSLPAQPANWRAKRHPSPHSEAIGWASRRTPGRRRTSTPSVGAEDHTHATCRYSLIGSGPLRACGWTTFRDNYPRCPVLLPAPARWRGSGSRGGVRTGRGARAPMSTGGGLGAAASARENDREVMSAPALARLRFAGLPSCLRRAGRDQIR